MTSLPCAASAPLQPRGQESRDEVPSDVLLHRASMDRGPDLPAWGVIPEERASLPQAAGHASDSASVSGRHSKPPFQDHARMFKGSVSRQPSAESDDRHSTEYQIIANDTSGENSVSNSSQPSSGDEAAPGPVPSSSRRGKWAGHAWEGRDTLPYETSGLPRSSSSGDVSRVLRPAASAGAERLEGAGGSGAGKGKGVAAASSGEEEQPSLELRRAHTHALYQAYDPASGHASDGDSSIHSEREERRWFDESRLRIHGIDAEAASLPSNSPLAGMGVMQAASAGDERPEHQAHGAATEPRKKAGFFKGALQAMKKVGRTSKGATELDECLDGTEHAEHGHRLERRGSLPLGGAAAGALSPVGGGAKFFGRQSSIGAELSGAAKRVAARPTRRRNQSCDADLQAPDTVGPLASQETQRRPRVQRVWTRPDGGTGSSPLMTVPEGGGAGGVFQKKRGLATGGHNDSLASLASRPAVEISVVSSAMPAMRTAVPPAVVHQITARSEPVVACQMSPEAACPSTPSTLGVSSPRPSARVSSGAVNGVQAAAQAQVTSPFTPISLPETALAVASPGPCSEALFLTSSHPGLMSREAGGGDIGTPVKAAVTPMKAAVTPVPHSDSAGGTPARSLAGSRGEGSIAGAVRESPARGEGQRPRWKVLTEEIQDVMIGILVLVSLCSLFLGKISALVATLAVALLASRAMPPTSTGTRRRRHEASRQSSAAKAKEGLQGAASGQSPLLPQADSGGFGGTPKTESVKRQQQIQNILQYSRTTDPKARHVLEGLLSRPTKTKSRR